MKIYVASSWRNEWQPTTVEVLREAGHDVYDFRQPTPGGNGFHWTEVEAKPRPWDVATFKRALAHPIAEQGYALDFKAMQNADACVLVLPAGRSAAFELGWMMGAGCHGVVLQLGDEEPELMFHDAAIVGSWRDLTALLACQHCGKALDGVSLPPGFCGIKCLSRAAVS